MLTPTFLSLVLASFLPLGLAQDIDPDLVAKLRAAPTQPDRINLLQDPQFVFNFLSGVGESKGQSGSVTSANAGNFPAVIGNGVAMSVGYLEACGLNIPHTHPRATEINFAVNGTLRTGMLAENGARFVFNDVPAGAATVFPKGAIHFEMNTECSPTLFVAAFNNEDPGTLALGQRFFGIPTDIVAASLNSLGVVEIAELESKIPNNVAQGTADCLQRCGIQHVDMQPNSQRQPRNAGNQLPPGFSGPPPAATPTPTTHAGIATAAPTVAGAAPITQGSSTASQSFLTDKNALGFVIALLVINGLFVVGALAALFLYVARKRGARIGGNVGSASVQDKKGFVPLDENPEYYDPYQRRASPVTPET